jgi:hypothetical protein
LLLVGCEKEFKEEVGREELVYRGKCFINYCNKRTGDIYGMG